MFKVYTKNDIIFVIRGEVMDLIRMTDVQKTYKTGTVALYDVDLTISKGEFVFIIGPTASGKSSLLKLFYREEKPNKGEVWI